EEVADVARAEHAADVVHRPLGAGGLEPVGMADDPARHEAAVAAAEDAQTLGIDEVAPAQGLVETGHHVLVVAAAPVADHATGEFLAIAMAPAWVREDDHVAGSGVNLELVEEAVPVLRVRTAVDVQEGWVPLSRLVAERPHDPAIELDSAALVAEALRPGQCRLRFPLAIQIGELALAAPVGGADVDLGGRGRVGCGEGDRPA